MDGHEGKEAHGGVRPREYAHTGWYGWGLFDGVKSRAYTT